MLNVWSWIRGRVKEAVLGGVHDALAELDGDEAEGTSEVAAALKARLHALPPAGEQLPSPMVATNGRKREKS